MKMQIVIDLDLDDKHIQAIGDSVIDHAHHIVQQAQNALTHEDLATPIQALAVHATLDGIFLSKYSRGVMA